MKNEKNPLNFAILKNINSLSWNAWVHVRLYFRGKGFVRKIFFFSVYFNPFSWNL